MKQFLNTVNILEYLLIFIIPFSSEWQSVRHDINASKGSQNYKQALRKLLLWKTR